MLSLGARGADVVQLERRLKAFGAYHGPFTRFYNARTAAAVRAFQHGHDLPVTGIATPEVLQLSAERIVVHLSQFRVFLIRDGKRVFSAPIAIGHARLPDADRHLRDHRQDQESHLGAAELALGRRPRAHPAGREQPARVRAGSARARPTSASTPRRADYSVGHAASHGCMRMHRADVERLYDLVRVGTPVDIEV